MSPSETSVHRVLVAPNKSTMLVESSRVESSRVAALQGRRGMQFLLLGTDFLLD